MRDIYVSAPQGTPQPRSHLLLSKKRIAGGQQQSGPYIRDAVG